MAADCALLLPNPRGQAAQQVAGLRLVPGKHPDTISLERHAEKLYSSRMTQWRGFF